jgi:deoxyribonuclease-4
MKIGAHLSIAGGYHKALERIDDIGGNCLQIFSASPRGWNRATITEEAKQLFLETKKKLEIDEVFFHASYLVNLADEGRIGEESKKSLIAELNVASQLGIVGSIVHTGSFKGSPPSVWNIEDAKYNILIRNIKEVLDTTPDNTSLILENAGNKKIGQNIDEIASIIRDVGNVRLNVCLDTCHLFSAGYELATQKKLDDFLIEFETKIGLNKLVALHINDSRDPFDSGRDRHENIGQGTLSMEPFKLLLKDKRTRDLPFIIETPGFDGKGPDKKNIDILKSLIYKSLNLIE